MADPAACDPAELARLHAASFTTPRPWSADEIASLLRLPHIFLLTETGPSGITGFLIGTAIAGEGELLTLAVDPAHRRQGIGQRLVTRLIATAEAREASRLILEVAAGNGAAIALYTRNGFHEAGRRRAYYLHPDGRREDALVLAHSG